MKVSTITPQQLADSPQVRCVDLRSPTEFGRDHIRGAENVPLFDDDQRAVVGTLYKQESPDAAYAHGLEIMKSRLGGLLVSILGREIEPLEWRTRFDELAEYLRDGATAVSLEPISAAQLLELDSPYLALYCWRGGMRSRSMSALLIALGVKNVVLVDGGYKSYRQWVREKLESFSYQEAFIVLRGPTGVGKTHILHNLEDALPGSTIDLEGLAQHRSSILGAVGLEPVSKPEFDSRLLERLRALGARPWFVEGESRKVGDVEIPPSCYEAMESCAHVRLDAPMEYRTSLLAGDYLATEEHVAEFAEQLKYLEKRLGAKWVGRLREWLADGRWQEVAEVLLESWYDPKYGHHDEKRDWLAQFDASSEGLIADLSALRARSMASADLK